MFDGMWAVKNPSSKGKIMNALGYGDVEFEVQDAGGDVH